jgi:ABC-type sugar transport system ATPase subunit
MNLVRVAEISKKKDDDYILQHINLDVPRFFKLAIAGETGSGKTTLLKIIAGLIQPTEGEVWLNNEKIAGPEEKLLPGHSAIAYLSQHFELRNNYRVHELLEMATKVDELQARYIYSISQVDHLLQRKTDQLSGGEKQRIALARLLVTAPTLLLLDEPYSNIDMIHKHVMKQVIRNISAKLRITCILISHDPDDSLSWANEIVVMRHGRIVQQASPAVIYNQPADEYTAGLFGHYNVFTLEQAEAFSRIPGIVLNGKNMLVRPEKIQLVSNQQPHAIGAVIATRFYGAHYEADVLVANEVVTIRCDQHTSKGDVVYLSINADDIWYL